MNDDFNQNTNLNTTTYKPVFLNMGLGEDAKEIQRLMNDKNVTVYNNIYPQVAELIKTQNPGNRFSPAEMEQKVAELLKEKAAGTYGTWVYYPWSNRLVHILDEEDFITVRTNRNLYKITPEESALLRTKKIAIIGLSVGQTIAQTIATERICGELRLADFDTLELGNLNRLNAGVQDLGLHKVVIAARKIAEIDPYIKVQCWPEGINVNNIDEFLTGGEKVDVLVEECDSFDIKVISRIKAKQYGIAVVMDTNDIGMLDVERYDIENNRAIFHGKIPELETMPVFELAVLLKNLSFEEKVGYLAKIIGFENTSDEMKFSLSQLGKTITGWPQLASAVTLGAAVATDTCRRILLGKFLNSGRFFVRLDKLVQ